MSDPAIEATVTEILRERIPQWNGDLDSFDWDWIGSLEAMELIFEIEERLLVPLPDEPMEVFKVPRDLIKYVETYRHTTGAV